MSLYHEAASILAKSTAEKVSIRTIVFAKKDWKSPVKILLALSSEAAKWSSVISEVIENSGILRTEKQLTPLLALALVHDLLLAKRGVALPINHGLNGCVQRNKARLNAELTKSRLRRQCSSVEQLRAKVEAQVDSDGTADAQTTHTLRHPRWVRVNAIRSTVEQQLETTFKDFTRAKTIQDILRAGKDKLVYVDEHIPSLLAVPSSIEFASSKAYKNGEIIFQDKASCFPAYLIDPSSDDGDFIDACAAPGNKTTHLAALLHVARANIPTDEVHIYACEKDAFRSKTLTTMTTLAGADRYVQVKQNQNFLKLAPESEQFANVTKLLLDPSCSGSGIVSRDQGALTIHLPQYQDDIVTTKSKKRKREARLVAEPVEEETVSEPLDEQKMKARLDNLADFQLRLLQHAMLFPAARQISYSTCSIHAEENEGVVVRALTSELARQRGWTVQRRVAQVPGLQKWHIRGDHTAVQALVKESNVGLQDSAEDIAEACIRCEKKGEDGTMGFFVAGFVRNSKPVSETKHTKDHDLANSEDSDDWSGFHDS